MTTLTAIILTHDEAAHVEACIDALRWADEVVVFDSFSDDDTPALARAAGARVIQHPFENFGAQRNAALEAVDAEWVLFVDADERVTPALAAEIRGVLHRPERGWWVPRHNIIFGKLTKGAGWFPDYQLRLLHRASAHYDPTRPVHETVILGGQAGFLTEPLTHYNYRSVAQFHAKQRSYSTFEAQRRVRERLLPKPWTPFSGAVRHFWWRYVTLGGWRLGLHGLRLSLLMAYYEAVTWFETARLARADLL